MITDYLMSLERDAVPHHAFLFVESPLALSEEVANAWLSHLGITERDVLDSRNEDGSRETIGVKKIRECIDRLSRTSFFGGYRAVVIDRGDDLSVGASNALLKILEEPPVSTLFVILATDSRSLLSTIVSRCFSIRFRPADHHDLLVRFGNRWSNIAYRASHSFAEGALDGVEFSPDDCERIEAFLSVQLHDKNSSVPHERIAELYDGVRIAKHYLSAHLPTGRALESVFL